MVLIQPINATTGLDTSGPPSTARDDSIGRALQGLGNEVQRAADVQQRLVAMERKRAAFTAELLWQRTQQDLDALHEEALENFSPVTTDFTAGVSEVVETRYTDFLDALPTEQQERFVGRIAADREARLSRAAADEVRERQLWYERGIASVLSAAVEEIAIDPSRSAAKRRAINDLIEQADLPEARLAELRQLAEALLKPSGLAGEDAVTAG